MLVYTSSKRGKGLLNKILQLIFPSNSIYLATSIVGMGLIWLKELKEEILVLTLWTVTARSTIYSSQHKDVESRNKADEVLERGAWDRVLARDASLGEKAAA